MVGEFGIGPKTHPPKGRGLPLHHSPLLVLEKGLEPLRLSTKEPKSFAYAISPHEHDARRGIRTHNKMSLKHPPLPLGYPSISTTNYLNIQDDLRLLDEHTSM